MGVQGLWELLAPVGRRVSVETLAGKKLAIDASIWMVQFMKAMRDEKGEMVRNAHLLGFFRRICKLLFLRVRPVFVFDGATPALKRRTLAARRRHRDAARAKIRKTAEKLLINHLKARKLEELAEEMRGIGEKGKEGSGSNDKGKNVAVDAPSEPSSAGDAAAAEAQERLDELLARSLAAEEEEVLAGAGESSGAGANEEEEDEDDDEELMLPELHGNIDPNILASLPPSIQLDLLVQMRERLMAENRQKYQKIKKAPAKFSQLQIQSYLKTVAFRREIDEVQKAAAGRGLGGVQTSRIASEANREFIFSTSFTGNKQMLSSLTMDKENNSMQSESTVKESTEVSNSSTSDKRILSQVSADISTNFGNDIETYRDERGRFRMSRIRALGIRMTRDIERNLDLIKEQEKEYYTRDTSVALEASIPGGDGVDFPSVDARVSQSTCFSGNDSVMEISFLDGDQVGQDDVGDHFFSHLVVGTSPTKSVADCKSVEKCSKDSSSDSDDLWEEGTNITTKHLNTNSLHEKIQSCHVDEDVNWEENFAFRQGASNKHVECNVTLSKGLLEEEAEIKEAIRRSLEDVGQTFVKESLDHGLIGHVDGPIVPLSQNCSPEGLQLEQEIDDNVLHVHASAGENIDQSSIKRCPVPNIKTNRNCDSFEHEGTSESTENTQHLILNSSSDISTDAGFSDKISAIVGQGQILRNCIVDSSEANLPSYPSSISAHNNITINKSFQQSEPFLPNRPVVNDTDKQGEGLLSEDVTDAKSENYYGDKRELNQVKTAASADIMQSPITTPNLMEMTLDKKKLSNEEDNSLLTHMDKPRCDLEEVTPLEYQKERQPQLSLDEEMSKLRQERENLGDEQRRHEINADSVSSEMFAECQELLQMFGLPYIIAPMEAEAQCAHMELVDLVDGVVTDDSDVFLFGARNIYKNIFDDRKYVETYYMKDIESELGLTREKLIRMALLLGSDYTEGVSGIGIVNAIEVVHAFPDEDSLRKFREWLESPDPDILDKIDPRITGSSKKKLLKPANKVKDKSKKNSKSNESNLDESTEETSGILLDAQKIFMSKHRNVSKNWHMPSSFPSQTVISAYSSPQVDESTEPFSWGKPDLLLLRKLCWEKFGWSNLKADELLLPVLKEYSKHETQLRLEAFYSFNERFAKIRSQRIKKAVKGITGRLSAGLLGIPEQDESSPQEASRELDPSSVSQQTECDPADGIQPSNSRDGCIAQVSIEVLDDIKHGQRKGRKGRGRGQESGKSKVTAYRNEMGRGRARGRQRGKPGKDHLESGTSEDERNVSGSIDNAARTISEIRRSGRQHKMAKYTEESSEDDGSCLPGTSNSIDANQATTREDPVTSMLGGHGEPCSKKLDYLEDNIPNDYLFSGGGFCADEDGTSTAGNPSEGVSSYMGEVAGSDRENIPGSECLTIQFKSKPEESAQSGAEAPASTVNTSGLRSMPMLIRKRKKMQ